MVVAKFRVTEVTSTADFGDRIKLSPVTGGSDENKEFFKYTPSGEITLGVLNPEAASQFTVGREMYVSFEPVADLLAVGSGS